MPEWEQAREWGWIMRTGELTGTGSHHFGIDEFEAAYDVFSRASDTGALKVAVRNT